MHIEETLEVGKPDLNRIVHSISKEILEKLNSIADEPWAKDRYSEFSRGARLVIDEIKNLINEIENR